MRIAVIDMGTNTFNLLVVNTYSDATYRPVFKTKVAVNLGQGGITKNVIAPLAFKRGIDAIGQLKAIAAKFEAVKLYAFATSGIRSARNGGKFVKIVKQLFNVDVQIINGDREAELIYYGVRDAVYIGPTRSLLLDIGGGSNEFIIATQDTISWKESFDLGMARLLEKFNPSDPILPIEIIKIEKYLNESLSSLFEAVEHYPVKELIGAAGSFETFVDIIAHRFFEPDHFKGKTEVEIELEHFYAIHQELIQSTHADRQTIKGLIELRVDMIVLASIFVNFIIQRLAIKRIRYSKYALKEGVMSLLVTRSSNI